MNLLPFNDPEPDASAAEAIRRSADQHPNTGILPELLTIRELAKVLKLSPRSIWRLVKNHQLPAPVRIGGSIRWRADDITRWIDDGCQDAGELKPRVAGNADATSDISSSARTGGDT